MAAQSFKSQPGAALEVAEAGDFEKDQPFTAAVWVKLSQEGMSGAIIARMNDQVDHRGWDLGVENGRVNAHFIHNWDADALKVLTDTAVKVGEWNHLLVNYDGSGKAAGVKIYFNGVPQPVKPMVDRLQNTIRTEVPLKIAQRQNASRLNGAAIQDLRIYGPALADSEVAQLAKATRIAYLVAKPAAERAEPETAEVFNWWLATLDKPTQELTGKLANLDREEKEIKGRGTVAHVMQERTEAPKAYVLFRGQITTNGANRLTPGTPAALPPMPAELPRNRLGFAQWLLRPEHPLTARVTVNRFWQELFGTGIVRTTGDFGVVGRNALASGIARLAGGRVPRVGLGREEVLRCWSLRPLIASRRGHAREVGKGSAEPVAVARPAVPHGCRNGSRLCPGGERVAGAKDRRAERAAVSAAGRVGGGGDDRQQHPRLRAGPWRNAVSPQPVHVLEAGGAAGVDGYFQRPVAARFARCGASGRTRRCRRW